MKSHSIVLYLYLCVLALQTINRANAKIFKLLLAPPSLPYGNVLRVRAKYTHTHTCLFICVPQFKYIYIYIENIVAIYSFEISI